MCVNILNAPMNGKRTLKSYIYVIMNVNLRVIVIGITSPFFMCMALAVYITSSELSNHRTYFDVDS